MTGFDDTSDLERLFDNPTFQAELDQACKTAFKRFSNPPYDTWEDLRSDVFILLRQSERFFLQYRELTNAKGYLYRIALNCLISRYRHERTERQIISLEGLESLAGDFTAEQHDLAIFIQELLNDIRQLLNPNERFVIESFLEGKSFVEIAAESKVTRAAISKRFASATKKIQRHLMGRRHLRPRT